MRSTEFRKSFTTRLGWPLLTRLIPLTVGVILIGLALRWRFPNLTWLGHLHTGASALCILLTVVLVAMVFIQNHRVRTARRKGPIMAIRNNIDPLQQMVPIVKFDGDEYDDVVNATEGALTTQESVDAVVAHMSQWDYGDETDGAASVNGTTALSELLALPHDVDEARHGGLDYLLISDPGLRFCVLYRVPLDADQEG